MTRCIALAAMACVWSLPASAATVNLQFEAVVDSLVHVEEAAISQAVVFDPETTDPRPLPGDVVSGSLAFEIDAAGNVGAPFGSLPIAGDDPDLESVSLSPIEVEDGMARGTIEVVYGPNTTLVGETFDSSVQWLDAMIHVAAPSGDGMPPSTFFDLLASDGSAPIGVDYTRITRGMVFFPGVDRNDCGFFVCKIARATVTSGTITLSDTPAPIPLSASVTMLLAGLGGIAGLFGLRRRRLRRGS